MTQNASTYYTTLSYGAYIFTNALYFPLGIIGILGNTLVLIAYTKYKKFREIPCAHLITTLSVCDFICGCGNILLGAARLEIALFNDYGYTRLYCLLTGEWSISGAEMSHVMMVAIAIDRLIAVNNPLFYRSRNHIKYAIGSFLIASLARCTKIGISLIGVDFSVQPSRCSLAASINSLTPNATIILIVLLSVLTLVIYATVLYQHWKSIKRIHTNDTPAARSTTDSSVAAQVKMTKLVAALVVLYLSLIAFPQIIFSVFLNFNLYPAFTNTIFATCTNLSWGLNSSVNVIVYVRSSSALKPFLLQLLTCGAKSRSTAVTDFLPNQDRSEGSQPMNGSVV